MWALGILCIYCLVGSGALDLEGLEEYRTHRLKTR